MGVRWNIRHKAETVSTNLDARAGVHGDVFTAAFQTAGRGRLDHTWLSAPGENLMLSAVVFVGDCSPERVATLPIVTGLAVIEGLTPFLQGLSPFLSAEGPFPSRLGGLSLKWPNDVLYAGRKLAGILCERHGDHVILGLGVNVNQMEFAPEIENKAISLARLKGPVPVPEVRDAVLACLGRAYEVWLDGGLSPFLTRLEELDFLRGRTIAVKQTDDDAEPIQGLCKGIAADGSLLVGDRSIYAGEAHVNSSQWYG